MEKDIDYPAEVTFKSVFRSRESVRDDIEEALSSEGLQGSVHERESRKGTFVSFTVTASFPSEKSLNTLCDMVASIDGFMTMF